MRLLLALLLNGLVVTTGWATDWYVATTGNDTTGTGTITQPFLTVAKGLRSLQRGDQLWIRGGSYSLGSYGSSASDTYGCQGAGGCPTSWETATKISNYPGEAVVIKGSLTFYGQRSTGGVGYVIVEGDQRANLIFTNSLGDPTCPETCATTNNEQFSVFGSATHHVRLKRIRVKDYPGQGFTSGNSDGAGYPYNIEILDSDWWHIGHVAPPPHDTDHVHCMYPGGGTDWLIADNYIFNCFAYGIHMNGAAGALQRFIIRGNRIEGKWNPNQTSSAAIFISSGSGHKIYDNIMIGKGTATGAKRAACIGLAYTGLSGADIYNNVCYDTLAYGIQTVSLSSPALIIKNNIFASVSNPFDWNGVSVANMVGAGNLCQTNDTDLPGACAVSGVAPGFVNATGGNFTLSSSSPAINAGVPITDGTHPCNGACEIGPYETFGFGSATINTTLMDVTLGMNTNVPLLPATGLTGFTVACTGTGCGTPTVQSAFRLSDSVVRLTVAGIGGTGVCLNTQVWTVSYSPGNVTDGDTIGGVSSAQSLFAFSGQGVAATCGGGGGGPPSGPYIWHKLDENTGIAATDSGSASLPGVLTGSPLPTWTTAREAYGVRFVDASNQQITFNYGNGVNPLTTSHTVAFGINIDAAAISQGRTLWGSSSLGGNRWYISMNGSQFKIGIQNSNDGVASEFAVTTGWHRLCLTMDKDTPGGGIGTATLWLDGVAATSAGAKKTYTSYSPSSNFVLGSPFSGSAGAIYDEMKIWQSKIDCATDFSDWSQTPPPAGTLLQVAHQFQFLRKLASGEPELYGAVSASMTIAKGGSFGLEVQTDCSAAGDCPGLSQQIRYSKNGAGFQPVPDAFTVDQVRFYGATSDTDILSGVVRCCLLGSLTPTDGSTQFTSSAIPNFDLAPSTSVTNRYMLQFGEATIGDVYCFKAYSQTGVALSSYSPSGGACLTITDVSMKRGGHRVSTTSTLIPGGFVEATGTTARSRMTLAEITAFVPATRTSFTFPSPYNTTGWRLTIPSDCTSSQDCVEYIGYSYWLRMNNHIASNTMYLVLGLNSGRGGAGNTLFTLNKLSGTITKVGNLFPGGDSNQTASGEYWYFSYSLPTALYMTSTYELKRYDILTQTYTTAVTIMNRDYLKEDNTTASLGCTTGSCPRSLYQFHSNVNDSIHAGTLRDGSNAPLGCVVYLVGSDTFRFYPETNMDECNLDKSGRYVITLVPFGTSGDAVGNKIYDNLTGALVATKIGPSGTLGHLDTGYGYALGMDNNGSVPTQPQATTRLDFPSASTATLLHYNPSWNTTTFNHPSHTNAVSTTLRPLSQQCFCGSNADSTASAANEIMCTRADGTSPLEQLVVAPVMTDLSASGGAWNNDDYGQAPKGHLDVTGHYFLWTTNMGGSRLDAFLVQVPTHKLVPY